MNTFMKYNINAIKQKNSEIAHKLQACTKNNDYTHTVISRTGIPCPVLKNGHLLHSKYNPEKEVANLFSGDENFVLFIGIGASIQLKYFLENFREKKCAISEYSYESFKSLLSIIDLHEILQNDRIIILPPVTDANFSTALKNEYLPVIHGNFEVKTLRAWTNYFEKDIQRINTILQNTIKEIQADFSVQAHFGKLWTRNIFINLKMLQNKPPIIINTLKKENSKIAFILGAGPNLEQTIPKIKKERSSYVLFATDTSYSVLVSHNIIPEFYIAIDPQYLSYLHIMNNLHKNVIGIFDLCIHPTIPRLFLKSGNKFIFTTGNHPLCKYVNQFYDFQYMDTSSGTVAIAALDVANRLGFSNYEFAGIDFAYTNGKAYANGTYLSKIFHAHSIKTNNIETLFSKIIFRSETIKEKAFGKITYNTNVLKFYAKNLKNYHFDHVEWTNTLSKHTFSFKQFYSEILKELKNQNRAIIPPFLPFLAYLKNKKNKNIAKNFDFDLVIKEVLKYN